jgi:hypothetical protein
MVGLYFLEYERQFENVKTVTVMERIGNLVVRPIEEIPLHDLEEAVDDLLELLYENAIVVDSLEEWDDLSAYRYLTEELLDSEMDDICLEE